MRRPAHGRGAGVGLSRAGLVAAVAALTLAGCGGSGHTHSAQRRTSPSTAATARAKRHSHPPPALLALRAALRAPLAHAGANTGAYVYDLTAKRPLYALRPNVRHPPASVEKLYTTVALLSRMDPGSRLHTTVLGDGELRSGGVWHGNLYLRGGGDPTLGDGRFNRIWEQGYGPTGAQLASALRAHGIRRVTGRLIGDGSLFDSLRGGLLTEYAVDVPDFGGQLSALSYDHGSASPTLTPEAFAARQLARTLRAQHVRVKATPVAGAAPKHSRVLARVSSPPLSVLVRLMDVPSDDLFAEMLTKQLGVRYGTGGTIAAGARVIDRIIQLYGIHPTIRDGSGLARSNGSSPSEVVELLRLVWHTPLGRLLVQALPVVGQSGTVQRIATGTAAQGHCVAKTGTLNYVTNLAGYCAGRRHHIVAFAFFIDGPPNWQALEMVSKLVAAVARY